MSDESIYDDGFAFQFEFSSRSLRSVAITNVGVPELRFEDVSSRPYPGLSQEDVGTICRLVSEGLRPNFTYRAIGETHPFYGRQYMVYHPPWLKGTSVGDVLSEVDWKMKCLNIGTQAPNPGSPFFSRENVCVTKGLATILDFADDNPGSPGYVFTRCAGVEVQTYDEELVFYSDPKLFIDYYKSKAYSEYTTRVLPQIAENDEPSFCKLQEIIKMVLAAEWLKEKEVEMSEKWMKSCTLRKGTVTTPAPTTSDPEQLLSAIRNTTRERVDISMNEEERKRSKGVYGSNSEAVAYGWYDNGSGKMVQYRANGEWLNEYEAVRTYNKLSLTINGEKVCAAQWLENFSIRLPDRLKVRDVLALEKNLKALEEHHEYFTILGNFSENIKVVPRSIEGKGIEVCMTAKMQASSYLDEGHPSTIKLDVTVRESTTDWDFIYQGLDPKHPMEPLPDMNERQPVVPVEDSWNELYLQTVPWPRVWLSSSPGDPGVLSATGGVRTDVIPTEEKNRDVKKQTANLHPVPARNQGSIRVAKKEETDSVMTQFKKAWKEEESACPKVHHVFVITNSGLEQRWKVYAEKLKMQGFGQPPERHFHGTSVKCGEILKGKPTLCQVPECSICGIVNDGFKTERIKGKSRFGKGFYLSPRTSKCHNYTDKTSAYSAQLLCEVYTGNKYIMEQPDQTLEKPPDGHHSVFGKVGDVLSDPELVIYDEDAIMPRYLIVYKN